MSVTLRDIRLPLARFTLEADVVLVGRVTALFGPSGSGKTSLLEIIAGLRRPVAGRVQIDDRVLTDVAARIDLSPASRAIGYVPQDGALFPHLSVEKNLRYGLSAQHDPARDLTLAHVAEVLEIAPLLGRAIGTLSGGEKQRVALGRALLAAPRLLLLDEPLAGLDVALKDRLMHHLQRVRDTFAIPMIYVTHSPDEVMALCDEVLVLADGRISRQGAPAQIFTPDDRPRYRLRG